MPTFTVTYSDAQEGVSSSSLAGLQGAPPPFAEVATASGQEFSAFALQGAGPPSIQDLATAVDAGGFDDLKGAGPPPVPGMAGAVATSGSSEDLGDAGPPPITRDRPFIGQVTTWPWRKRTSRSLCSC